MKVAFLLAGLVLSAMVLWLLHESTERGPRAASSPPRAALAARTGDPARRTPERIIAPPVLAAVAPDNRAPPPAPDGAEPSWDDRRAHLQAQFAAERTDATWATASRQALHDELGRFASADARLQDVECRSSLCRVVLALSNPEAGNRFVEAWLHERSWTGPGFVAAQDASPGGDPRPSMVVFLGRPGTELPHAP